MHAWYLEGSVIPFRFGRDDHLFVRLIGRYDEVDTNDKATFTPFRRGRFTVGTELEYFTNARVRFEWQNSKIYGFYAAPQPYRDAGGKRNIQMFMLSAIYSF